MERVFAALIFRALLFAARVNYSGADNPFQSWVRVTPRTDTTSVITIAHDAYDLLCDTAIIVKTRWGPCQHGLIIAMCGCRV